MAWMDLESIMLREINQSEKDNYHMTSLICGIYSTKYTIQKQTHRYKQTDIYQKGRDLGLGEKGKGIKQRKKNKTTQRHRQQYGD